MIVRFVKELRLILFVIFFGILGAISIKMFRINGM